MKKYLIFSEMAMSSWQIQNEFVPDFGCQNHIFLPGMIKFCVQHPNTKGNTCTMQLTPGLYL
jgi:hypothetical protein